MTPKQIKKTYPIFHRLKVMPMFCYIPLVILVLPAWTTKITLTCNFVPRAGFKLRSSLFDLLFSGLRLCSETSTKYTQLPKKKILSFLNNTKHQLLSRIFSSKPQPQQALILFIDMETYQEFVVKFFKGLGILCLVLGLGFLCLKFYQSWNAVKIVKIVKIEKKEEQTFDDEWGAVFAKISLIYKNLAKREAAVEASKKRVDVVINKFMTLLKIQRFKRANKFQSGQKFRKKKQSGHSGRYHEERNRLAEEGQTQKKANETKIINLDNEYFAEAKESEIDSHQAEENDAKDAVDTQQAINELAALISGDKPNLEDPKTAEEPQKSQNSEKVEAPDKPAKKAN